MKWGLGRASVLFALVFVAISSIDWTQQTQAPQSTSTTDMRDLKADYFLQDFKTIRFSSEGDSEYVLTGEKLLHFPVKAASQLSAPTLELLRKQHPRWTLTSKTGWFEEASEEFTLQGDVNILRSEFNQQPQIAIKAQDVTVLANDRIIHSDQAVDVSSKGWDLSADGFSSDLNNGKLSLLSNVRVHYEITP